MPPLHQGVGVSCCGVARDERADRVAQPVVCFPGVRSKPAGVTADDVGADHVGAVAWPGQTGQSKGSIEKNGAGNLYERTHKLRFSDFII